MTADLKSYKKTASRLCFERKNEPENRAVLAVRRRGDLSAVAFDNPPADREPQSHPISLRRDESIEDVPYPVRIDARP